MSDPDLHYVPITRQEADRYVYAIERVTTVWYEGKKNDRHLGARNLGASNSIQKQIAQLKAIAYAPLIVTPKLFIKLGTEAPFSFRA